MVTGVGAGGRDTSLCAAGDVATRRKITCEASDAADTYVTLLHATQQSDIPRHFFALPLVSRNSRQHHDSHIKQSDGDLDLCNP